MNKIKKLVEKNRLFEKVIFVCFRLYSFIFFLAFLLCSILPKDERKIVGSNMKGKRYGDNPKYIFDALIIKEPKLNYIWLQKKGSVENIPSNVITKKPWLWVQAYELATAKVWVDSNAKQYGFIKRKNQLYVQTWHGSYGLKKIGKDLKYQSRFDRDNMEYNFKYADITVSNSKRTSEIFRTAFAYKGKILEFGSPRNDIFFGEIDICKNRIKRLFNIEEKKILLYAPTFRNSFSTKCFDIDFINLKEILKKKFGGEWIILVRLHPNNLKEAERFIEYSDSIINATTYDIMQELLVTAELLITDYSSCMFDFVTTGKPCFLYATDIEEYKDERDYYFKFEDLPFPMATNNVELEIAIESFDCNTYERELQKLFERVGLFETGEASEKVAEYILDWMDKN